MPVAKASLPCLKLPISSASPPSSSSSSSGSNSKPCFLTISGSQTEESQRRPAAPSLRELSPPVPRKRVAPSPSPMAASPAPSQVKPAPVMMDDRGAASLGFKRPKDKEPQENVKQKKHEEADQGSFFGFLGKNGILNGREHIRVVRWPKRNLLQALSTSTSRCLSSPASDHQTSSA